MTGDDLVLLILGTTTLFVVGYVFWPVVKESRLAYRLWVWCWKHKR